VNKKIDVMRSKMIGSTAFLLAVCAITAFKPVSKNNNIAKSSIQNGMKSDYRVFHKSSYRIADTAGFYLYYRYVSFEQTPGKGLIKKDEYYFSKDSTGDIQLLTIENLKRAYPENHRFHYDLDAHFRSDRELMSFDPFTKMYKLKYLYMQSLKG
jgi:hypothetical protein